MISGTTLMPAHMTAGMVAVFGANHELCLASTLITSHTTEGMVAAFASVGMMRKSLNLLRVRMAHIRQPTI
jgi:hypothetical protein